MNMNQIRVGVQIAYRGKSIDAIALFDTGAETYAFIDTSIANKLGLPRGEAQGYSGIAGSDIGFKSTVDSMSFSDNTGCSLIGGVPVLVGQVNVPNVTLLIGEYFIKDTRMVADFSTKSLVTSCKGGPMMAVGQPIPKEYFIYAGVGGLLILASVFLFRD